MVWDDYWKNVSVWDMIELLGSQYKRNLCVMVSSRSILCVMDSQINQQSLSPVSSMYFINTSDQCHVLWVPPGKSIHELLRHFSQVLYQLQHGYKPTVHMDYKPYINYVLISTVSALDDGLLNSSLMTFKIAGDLEALVNYLLTIKSLVTAYTHAKKW